MLFLSNPFYIPFITLINNKIIPNKPKIIPAHVTSFKINFFLIIYLLFLNNKTKTITNKIEIIDIIPM